MSTRLRLTGLAILIPGIILGLLLAAQATPAMAEPPDDVKDFGLSLDLENTLPPPELAPTPTPEPVTSSTSTRNTRLPRNNVEASTTGTQTSDAGSRTASFDCNEYLGWPYPSGWKYNAPDDEYYDVGAYVHVGFYYNTGEPMCVLRTHTPGSNSTLCSQAPTWRSIGVGRDGKGYTGRLTLSGQPICLDEQGLRSDHEYIWEQHLKRVCARPENSGHPSCL